MSTVTMDLTDTECHAAMWAIIDELARLSEHLGRETVDFQNAQLDRVRIRAADVLTYARQVADLVPALEALVESFKKHHTPLREAA